MIVLLIVGFLMVGVSVLFCYLELLPFLDAMKYEVAEVTNPFGVMLFPLRVISHLPLIVPSAIDVAVTVFLSGTLGFGGGLLGGITGLFASNIISMVIFYHTHLRRHHA